MYGEGVHRTGKLFRQCRIDHPMALDPAFAGECRRDDADPEMRLAAGDGASMAGMKMRFINDAQAFRMERLCQLGLDTGLDRHDAATFHVPN